MRIKRRLPTESEVAAFICIPFRCPAGDQLQFVRRLPIWPVALKNRAALSAAYAGGTCRGKTEVSPARSAAPFEQRAHRSPECCNRSKATDYNRSKVTIATKVKCVGWRAAALPAYFAMKLTCYTSKALDMLLGLS
jgi:hypothetical protein